MAKKGIKQAAAEEQPEQAAAAAAAAAAEAGGKKRGKKRRRSKEDEQNLPQDELARRCVVAGGSGGRPPAWCKLLAYVACAPGAASSVDCLVASASTLGAPTFLLVHPPLQGAAAQAARHGAAAAVGGQGV